MKNLISEEILRIKELMLINEGFGDEAMELASSIWKSIRRSDLDLSKLRVYSDALERQFKNIDNVDVAAQLRNLGKDYLGLETRSIDFYRLIKEILDPVRLASIEASKRGELISLILKNKNIETSLTKNLLDDPDFMKKLANDINFTDPTLRYNKINTKLENLGLPNSIRNKIKTNLEIFVDSGSYKTYDAFQTFLRKKFNINWGGKVYSVKPNDVSYGVDDFLNSFANGSYKDLSSYAKKLLLKEDKMTQVITDLNAAVKAAGNDASKVNLSDVFEKSVKKLLGDVPYDNNWLKDNIISRVLLLNSKGQFSGYKFFLLLTTGASIAAYRWYINKYVDNLSDCISKTLESAGISAPANDASQEEKDKFDLAYEEAEKNCDLKSDIKTSKEAAENVLGKPVGVVKGTISAIGAGIDDERDIKSEVKNKLKKGTTSILTNTYTDDLTSFKKYMDEQTPPIPNSGSATEQKPEDTGISYKTYKGNGITYKFCKGNFITSDSECK